MKLASIGLVLMMTTLAATAFVPTADARDVAKPDCDATVYPNAVVVDCDGPVCFGAAVSLDPDNKHMKICGGG